MEQFEIASPIPSLWYIPDVFDSATQSEVYSQAEQEPFTGSLSRQVRVVVTKRGRMEEHDKKMPPYLEEVMRIMSERNICNYNGYVGREGERREASLEEVGPMPNQCIINKYVITPPAFIRPHSDGPFNTKRIAIVTFGSSVLMTFHTPFGSSGVGEYDDGVDVEASARQTRQFSMYLRPGSVMVFSGELYDNFHAIAADEVDEITEDCLNREQAGVEVGQLLPRGPQPRISLTFRHLL